MQNLVKQILIPSEVIRGKCIQYDNYLIRTIRKSEQHESEATNNERLVNPNREVISAA